MQRLGILKSTYYSWIPPLLQNMPLSRLKMVPKYSRTTQNILKCNLDSGLNLGPKRGAIWVCVSWVMAQSNPDPTYIQLHPNPKAT